jgi:hypothetical protein
MTRIGWAIVPPSPLDITAADNPNSLTLVDRTVTGLWAEAFSESELADMGVFPLFELSGVTIGGHQYSTGNYIYTYDQSAGTVTRSQSVVEYSIDFLRSQAIAAATTTAMQSFAASEIGGEYIMAIAARVAAGTSSVADNAIFQTEAVASGRTIATYAQSIVDATRARERQAATSARALRAQISTINAATTPLAAFQAGEAAVTTLEGLKLSPLSTSVPWAAWTAAGNAGTSVVASSGANKRFTRELGTVWTGSRFKLADLGIAPTPGKRLRVTIQLYDLTSNVQPMASTSKSVIGLMNSSLASHSTDLQTVIDMGAAMPVIDPPNPAGLTLTADVTLANGRDSIFVGGIMATATATMQVDIKSMTIDVL